MIRSHFLERLIGGALYRRSRNALHLEGLFVTVSAPLSGPPKANSSSQATVEEMEGDVEGEHFVYFMNT